MSLYNLLLLKEKKRTASANFMHLTYFTFAGLGAGTSAWDAWIRSCKKDRNLITKYTGVYTGGPISWGVLWTKRTWQIMWRKRILKWQPSKSLWIWIFGAVTKVRTMEKTITSVACYEVVWDHQLVLLNEKRSYTELVIVAGCLWFIVSCRMNKPQLSIGKWFRNHDQSWRNNTCLLS